MDESINNLNSFTQKLACDNDIKALTAIHERLMQYGYKMQTKHIGAAKSGFDIKYSIKSRKPIVQALYKKNKDAGFEIHMRPLNVTRYADRFFELTEHIRNCCINGKDCTKCGYCDKAYEYEYEGVRYNKCQFICFNFRFTNIDELDVDSIIRVLDMELSHIHISGGTK